jgi:hypothetical protein
MSLDRDMPRSGHARERIVRYLLGMSARNVPRPAAYEAPPESLYALAKRTDVTFSWVHKVVKELEARKWVRVAHRIDVAKPTEVFEWWAASRTLPERVGFHVRDPKAASAALRELGVPNALTTYYAENAYQGHLFPRRGDAYVRHADVPRAKEILLTQLDAQLGGTNFRLLAGDDHLLDETVTIGSPKTAVPYAPFPQVVADLIEEGGSAREAADMLIQKAYPHAHAHLQ